MGAATEANNAKGVGFFSPAGYLLGVVFDDVAEKSDAQKLEFNRYRGETLRRVPQC